MIYLAPILLGIGSAVTVLVAAQADNSWPLRLALGASMMWALANVLWLYNLLSLLPLLDWALGVAALLAWIDGGGSWARRVVAICYLRLGAHVIDQLTAQAFLVSYIHFLNALFLALLWVVAEPGGRNGLSRLRELRDHYFRRPLPATC